MKRKFEAPQTPKIGGTMARRLYPIRGGFPTNDFENFLSACKNNNLLKVQKLLHLNPKYIYAASAQRTNGFLYACGNGNEKLANYLLKADVRFLYTTNNLQLNAFHYACAGGHWELAAKLLDKNPLFLRSTTSDGHSAYDIAKEKGRVEICQNLLKLDEDFFKKNEADFQRKTLIKKCEVAKINRRRLLESSTLDLVNTMISLSNYNNFISSTTIKIDITSTNPKVQQPSPSKHFVKPKILFNAISR